MGEDRILLHELAFLLLVFAGPVYLVASVVQTILLTRAGMREHRARTTGIALAVSLLLAFPLTLVLWWLMGRLPPVVFSWLAPFLSWSPMGGIIQIPATVASLIAYTLIGRLALRRARARPRGAS
ncbi:MAG TPA: hypothetical protein VN539_06965 [Candidatus Saccharimonadales bacterium]|nr:hypothetical protein [Candidatus Saccharimonadales bacterium]